MKTALIEQVSTTLYTHRHELLKASIIPLAIGVVYLYNPYLLLDPYTSFTGLATVTLINTVALPCFHLLIKNYWKDESLNPLQTLQVAYLATKNAFDKAISTVFTTVLLIKANKKKLDEISKGQAKIEAELAAQVEQASKRKETLKATKTDKARAFAEKLKAIPSLAGSAASHQHDLEADNAPIGTIRDQIQRERDRLIRAARMPIGATKAQLIEAEKNYRLEISRQITGIEEKRREKDLKIKIKSGLEEERSRDLVAFEGIGKRLEEKSPSAAEEKKEASHRAFLQARDAYELEYRIGKTPPTGALSSESLLAAYSYTALVDQIKRWQSEVEAIKRDLPGNIQALGDDIVEAAQRITAECKALKYQLRHLDERLQRLEERLESDRDRASTIRVTFGRDKSVSPEEQIKVNAYFHAFEQLLDACRKELTEYRSVETVSHVLALDFRIESYDDLKHSPDTVITETMQRIQIRCLKLLETRVTHIKELSALEKSLTPKLKLQFEDFKDERILTQLDELAQMVIKLERFGIKATKLAEKRQLIYLALSHGKEVAASIEMAKQHKKAFKKEVERLKVAMEKQKETMEEDERAFLAAQLSFLAIQVQSEHLQAKIQESNRKIQALEQDIKRREEEIARTEEEERQRILCAEAAKEVVEIFAILDDLSEIEQTEQQYSAASETFRRVDEAYQAATKHLPDEKSGIQGKIEQYEAQKERERSAAKTAMELVREAHKKMQEELCKRARIKYLTTGFELARQESHYYHQKSSRVGVPIPGIDKIQRLKLRFHEEKKERAELYSTFNLQFEERKPDTQKTDLLRFELADHRLKREQFELEWRTMVTETQRAEKERLSHSLDEEIKSLYKYGTAKLKRGVRNVPNFIIKTNLAIIDLVLKRVYLEVTRQIDDTILKPFKITASLTALLDTTSRTTDAQAFTKQAGNAAGRTWMNTLFGSKEVNPILHELVKALGDDDTSTAPDHLANFFKALDGRTRALETDVQSSALPYASQLFRLKIRLIQQTVVKPFLTESGFVGRYHEYITALHRYKIERLKTKKEIADLKATIIGRKPIMRDHQRLMAEEALDWKKRVIKITRLDHLSYLAPPVVLFLTYGILAQINLIALSVTASRNLLMVSSMAYLFVQSTFFNRHHKSLTLEEGSQSQQAATDADRSSPTHVGAESPQT